VTSIREVDLSQPLAALLDLPAGRCMLVFRWRRRVIGRAFAHATGGSIGPAELEALAASSLDPAALRYWLDEQLRYDERAVIDPHPLTATVAICTHERPDDLRRALTGLQALHPAPLETLVIDNAPATAATRQVVESFPGVRYIHEPERGLNVARNRALRVARGDVVAFVDDDALPEPEWLDGLMPNFQSPRVVCVTGLTLPIALETRAQELFESHCSFVRGFRRRVFDGQCDNPLAVGPVGAGANMAVLRDAALGLGGFDERLDGGRPTRSGGDHEMFTRMLRAGNRIVYDPAAVAWHRHRRTMEELRQTVYGYGVGVYAMWTGLLVEAREIGVVKLAWSWFRHSQWRALLPADGTTREARALAREEIRGCLHGPRAWLAARNAHANGQRRD
jgi:glycosyltransferase involved in cell wall biosynthesis